MPGAAACAVPVNSRASAIVTTGSSLYIEIAFFIFIALIAALLVDMNFGHEPAEIFGVVGKVVEIGGVEIICPHGDRRGAAGSGSDEAGIENRVQRLSATQSDRVGVVIHVVSGLIPQQ